MLETKKVLLDVEQERINQKITHKGNTSLEMLFIVLSEEIGEVAQCLQSGTSWSKASDEEDLYNELIQVAAVAVKMAEKVRCNENKHT